MATADTSTNLAEDKEKLRDEWLARLSDLVETVRGWAEDLDWSTRRIETKMDDLEIGDYKAPALIIQKETVRAILEPIGRSAPTWRASSISISCRPMTISRGSPSTTMGGTCIICLPDRRTSGPVAEDHTALPGDVPGRPRSDDAEMPHDRHECWIRRIKSIERDHSSMRLALDRLLDEARRDPTILDGRPGASGYRQGLGTPGEDLPHPPVRRIRDGPPPVLGDHPGTEPPTQHLLDGIAARCEIPPDRLAGAHTVREYRNSLVHERDEGWPRSRSRRLGDICAASSPSSRRSGDPHPGHLTFVP